MAGSRTTFEKLQRDRAKKSKAEAKRAKRMGKALPGEMPRDEEPTAVEPDGEGSWVDQLGDEISPAELLSLVEQVQSQFDNNEIDFDEYEERKFELLARLTD